MLCIRCLQDTVLSGGEHPLDSYKLEHTLRTILDTDSTQMRLCHPMRKDCQGHESVFIL